MEIMKKERGKEKGGEGERNRETEIERERKKLIVAKSWMVLQTG